MTIRTAIQKAQKECGWNIAPHTPTSVNVLFTDDVGRDDATQFDLYSDQMEQELEELYRAFCTENNIPLDTVTEVETLGYIAD